MAIRVQAPDGTIIEFPDGMNDAQIALVMRREFGGPKSAAPPKDPAKSAAQRDAARRINSAPDQVRALSKGFSFGFADELDAASAAAETGVTNWLKGAAGKKPEYGMKDAFSAVMEANALKDAQYAKEHPVQNVGLQIVGGAVGPAAASGARWISGARSLGGATVRSAAVGGGLGAVAGAGNANGGATERAKGAVTGGATGLAIGVAAPAAGRAVQTAGRAANAAIGQPFGGASRGAAARLREALHQDGLDEAQIRQAVADWQRSGVTPEFLNVAGENTRALIRAAGGRQGPARNAAQNYRDQTVASIPNRAIERANALTPGETRTPGQFAESARDARQAAAQRNYEGPYTTPVDVPETVSDMLRDPAGRSIVARARADAIENQDWAMQTELDMLLNGAQNGQLPRVSAGTVDRLAIAARERGGTLAQRGARNRARGSLGRRDQLDEVLEAVPEIQPAREQYARQSRAIEAAEEGPSVMGPRDEFAAGMGGLDRNAFATRGAQVRERQALRDHFGTRDQVRGRLADIANAPDVRPNLQQLYGQRGEDFADAAGRLVQKQDDANFIAPNTGSQTQLRENDAQNAFGTVSVMMEAISGRVRPLLERVARGLTITEQERNLLVQVGIGSPDDALRALAAPPPAPARIGNAAARRVSVGAAPALAGNSGD